MQYGLQKERVDNFYSKYFFQLFTGYKPKDNPNLLFDQDKACLILHPVQTAQICIAAIHPHSSEEINLEAVFSSHLPASHLDIHRV